MGLFTEACVIQRVGVFIRNPNLPRMSIELFLCSCCDLYLKLINFVVAIFQNRDEMHPEADQRKPSTVHLNQVLMTSRMPTTILL